jgi:hypothetical protein
MKKTLTLTQFMSVLLGGCTTVIYEPIRYRYEPVSVIKPCTQGGCNVQPMSSCQQVRPYWASSNCTGR